MPSSATAAQARNAPFALARSVPAWAWLVGIVVCSTLVRVAFGRRMAAPWIMVDELVYSELAKSFAESGRFFWRDEPINLYGFVYPVLLSPAYLIHESVPDAYTAMKSMNALVMSLAAVPAYAIARRVLAPGLALVAAVLSIAVPSMLYTGTLMTENVFYAVFLCAVLALVLVLEEPTPGRQLLLLGATGLAYLTRVQAIALLPAIVTAPLLLAVFGRRGLRSLWAYWVLGAALGGGALLFAGAQVARGGSLRAVLLAYEAAGEQDYSVQEVARWLLYHVAGLDLYVGIVPFAALLLLVVVARGLPRAAQAFVAASVAVTLWLLVVVATFASQPTVLRVEERNLFYVAPLFFTALLLWADRGAPRPRAAVACALVAAALPAILPYERLIGVQAQSDTLSLLPWWWLQDHVITLSLVWLAVLVLGVGLAALFLLVPARSALGLAAVVAAYYAVTLPAIENGRHGVRMASLGAFFQGITTGQPDWVDRTVGRDADVAFVWSGRADVFVLWENEFFNRSVGRVYELARPLGGGLPATAVQIDRGTGLLHDGEGRELHADFVLTDESVPLAGGPVARDRPKGTVLIRTTSPLRVTQLVSGLYELDTWSGRRVVYTRLRCRGGRVDVDLVSDGQLFRRSQTVVARVGGRVVGRTRIPPGGEVSLSLRLRPGSDGKCRAVFDVSPTAVPARVLPGNPDTRVLGLHFERFTYSAP